MLFLYYMLHLKTPEIPNTRTCEDGKKETNISFIGNERLLIHSLNLASVSDPIVTPARLFWDYGEKAVPND